jgi:hypothetical protein
VRALVLCMFSRLLRVLAMAKRLVIARLQAYR